MSIIDVGTDTLLYSDFVADTVEAKYSGMSALQIYEAKCADAGLDPVNSLYGIAGIDDGVNSFDVTFSPLPFGGQSKVTWTSEGLIHLYFTGNNNNYGTGLTSSYSIDTVVGSVARAYFDGNTPLIAPAFSILFKQINVDGQTLTGSKVQHNASTCLLYIIQRQLNVNGTDFGICIELNSDGQMNYYVDNYNSLTSLNVGLISYDQSVITSYSNPVPTDHANSVILTVPTATGVYKYSTVPLTVYTIQGNVNTSGTPYVTSKVTALKQSDKKFVNTATPDANGDFAITVYDEDEHILICEDLAPTNPKNALIFDRVVGT